MEPAGAPLMPGSPRVAPLTATGAMNGPDAVVAACRADVVPMAGRRSGLPAEVADESSRRAAVVTGWREIPWAAAGPVPWIPTRATEPSSPTTAATAEPRVRRRSTVPDLLGQMKHPSWCHPDNGDSTRRTGGP